MTSSRRLTVVIHGMGRGGAERVAAMLVNHWAVRGDAVTLITLDSSESDAYPVAGQIDRVPLNLMRHSATPVHALWNNWKRIRLLGQAIRNARPDLVVSHCSETNVLTLLACRRPAIPVIVTEHSSFLYHRIGRIWAWLRRRMYPSCAALVVLTEQSRSFGRELVGNKPVFVIPNAVIPPPPTEAAGAGSKGPEAERRRIISMGRLAPEKGFDLLIKAFAGIAPQHRDWDLWILGEGPSRTELERLIARTGLPGRVHLPGWICEPYAELVQSDLYVLSSRYEGSPMALLEAMACGLPVVSFDCHTGPREVVRHEVDGLLVPPGDVGQLATAIKRLINDRHQRSGLAARAKEVTERFSVDAFFLQWDAALERKAT